MPSGWTRWLLEQFEFPFEVVYPADARCRQPEREVRRARSSSTAPFRRATRRRRRASRTPTTHPGRIPRPARHASPWRRPFPSCRKFVENGGTVLTIGSSTVARPSPRAADSRRAGRADRRRRGAAAAATRSSTSPARCSRRASTRTQPLAYGMARHAPSCSSTRARRSGCRRRRSRKGVKPVAWFDCADAAAQRLGVGTAVSRSGGRDRRGAGRQGPRRAVRPGDRCGARSRTARSSSCSTASTTPAPRRRRLARTRTVKDADCDCGCGSIVIVSADCGYCGLRIADYCGLRARNVTNPPTPQSAISLPDPQPQ